MAYATQQDMIDTQGQEAVATVSDRDGDGAIDGTAVTRALDAASDEMDSYLCGRYAVPVTATPVVKKVCIDMAMYLLAGRAAALTEEMRLRYTDAVAWLKLVAKGDVSIVGATPPGGGGAGDDDQGLNEVSGGKRAGVLFSRSTISNRPWGGAPIYVRGRISDWRRRMQR